MSILSPVTIPIFKPVMPSFFAIPKTASIAASGFTPPPLVINLIPFCLINGNTSSQV